MTLQVHKLILWIASAGPWGQRRLLHLKGLTALRTPWALPHRCMMKGEGAKKFLGSQTFGIHPFNSHRKYLNVKLNNLNWCHFWKDLATSMLHQGQIHPVPGTSSTGWAHWSPRYQAVVPSVGRSSAPKSRPWSKLHGLGGADDSGQVISHYSILPS